MDIHKSPGGYPSKSSKTPQGSAPTHTHGDPPVLFRAICLYEFSSEDPSHLTFRRGDLLAIIQTERTGWSGARGRNGDVGWVPTEYLAPLTNDQASYLEDFPDEMRFFEYEAETRYRDAPIRDLNRDFPVRGLREGYPPPPVQQLHSRNDSVLQDINETSSLPPYESPSPPSPAPQNHHPYSLDGYSPDQEESEGEVSPLAHQADPRTLHLQIPEASASNLNKPTPPTPIITDPSFIYNSQPYASRIHNLTQDPIGVGSSVRSISPRVLHPTRKSPSPEEDDLPRRPARQNKSKDKVQAILGENEAREYYERQIPVAWYLRPQHVGEEIQFERGGIIKAGTIDALIERLVIGVQSPSGPSTATQDKIFRRTFLTTFKTFTSAEQLFESLWLQYRMDPPSGLNSREEQVWVDSKLIPVQKRVLTLFKEWLEHYWLVDEDPYLIPRITHKLSQITDGSATQTLSVKDITQTIERLVANCQNSVLSPKMASSISTRSHNRRVKTDILQVEHQELANQLTLYEFRLYSELQARECLVWHKIQTGDAVQNLVAFVSHSNKLASWVKCSILSKDRLGERADAVDKWIRVAEKCRQIHNISSTCSIVAALSSSVIERLHLTWARVERKGQLVTLQNLAQPDNNFRECRELLKSIVTSCVPFIGMNLTDLTHTQDAYPDNIAVEPSAVYPQGLTLINFAKRQACVDIIDSILRHQSKPYKIAEKPATITFLEQQLAMAAHEDSWFWQKSQELQQSEVAHADIKRNLEAAGF